MDSPQARLPTSLKVGYGIGSLGTGIYSVVPGLLLLFFLVEVLDVPPAWAGVAILIPKLWDVIIDPALGGLSDRLDTRYGNRLPLMAMGGALLPLFFFLMFSPPGVTGGAAAVYVIGVFVLAATAFSLYQVPYIALPAELTTDREDRTRLIALRIVMLTIGILLGGAVAPAIVNAGGEDRPGFRLMGLIIGSIAGVAMLTSVYMLRKGRRSPPVAQPEGIREQLRRAWENRPFATLLTGYFIQLVAVNAMLAGAAFFSRYLLEDDDATTILFVALVAPAALVMPLWTRISFRVGKQRAFIYSVIGFAVVAASLATVAADRAWLVYLQAALLGAFYGGTQLFPFSMLPDTIDEDTATDGQSRAGSFTGIWTAGETTGAALGPALFAVILAITGFQESADDEFVIQTATALTGIRLGFTILPAVLLIASLWFIRRYREPRSL